jgi:hypothetical protein
MEVPGWIKQKHCEGRSPFPLGCHDVSDLSTVNQYLGVRPNAVSVGDILI